MTFRTSRLGFRARLVLLAVTAAMLTGTATSIAAYFVVRNSEFDAADKRLEAAARLHTAQLREALNLLRTDGLAVSAMPPVSGMIRSIGNPDAIDRQEDSTTEHWQRRLEQIFAAILDTRPGYTQLRYIGRADNWTELVRVNRSAEGPVYIRGAALQAKGAEPYLNTESQLSRGQPILSQVTLNRELGRAEGPPTIRLMQPVMDRSGQLFGAIVINADFGRLLRNSSIDPPDGIRVQVVTDAGDYMDFSDSGAAGPLRFHEDVDWRPSAFASAFEAGEGATDLAQTDEHVFRTNRLVSARVGAPFAIGIVTSTPSAALLASAERALLRSVAISAVLVLFAGLSTAAAASRLPVARLARAVRDRTADTDVIDLPLLRDDVTDDLARAYAQMSRKLLAQTVRLRAIYRSVPDGIVTIDGEGTIESANPAMSVLFGYATDELIGAPVELLMPDEFARRHHEYVQAASDLDSLHVMAANRDIHGVRKDGSTVPIEISVSRLGGEEGPHFVGVIRDITERRRAEAETEALVAALRQSNEELDKYAFVASHDLKAPLRVIDNVSCWLEEDLAPHLTDDTRESIQMLRSRVRRMERLLDDLLTHSRIGRSEPQSTRITGAELAETLKGLVHLPREMSLEISDGFSEIEVQNMPLTTVLLNLVGNAIKHHDRPDGHVSLSVRELQGGYEFTVADDGPGIAPSYHERIFEMFQTLRPRDEVDGSGLGLAMVRKYVALAGGRISVDSDGIRGTRFVLFWPHEAAEQAHPGIAA